MKTAHLMPLLLTIFAIQIQAYADSGSGKVSQPEAVSFCANQGAHLPSAREWANVAVQRGAKGLRETQYPGERADSAAVLEEIRRNEVDGYQTIYFTKPRTETLAEAPWAGDYVDFYYSRDGYVPPENPEDRAELWSSTVNQKKYDWAWYFRGDNGFLTFQDRWIGAAVQCASDHPENRK